MEEILDGGQPPLAERGWNRDTDSLHEYAKKNQERLKIAIQKRLFFFGQQKVKAEQSFSMGLFVVWAIDQEAMTLGEARGAKWKSWAERECPSNAGLDS